VYAENSAAVDDFGAVSPVPPALPPRRYRGEMDLTTVDRSPPIHRRISPSLRSIDTTNGESTLPHDTYANQLRRQARRYQQTRGSSFSHPRPPPPDWKPPPPPPVLPQYLLPFDDPISYCRSSELKTSQAEVESSLSHIGEAETGQSWIEPALSSSNHATESGLQKSLTYRSLPEVDAACAGTGISALENETSRVERLNLHSPREGTSALDSFSDRHLGSTHSVTCEHPVVDVVSGYDRYYSLGSNHSMISLSRSFSSVIPSDSPSSELPSVRRLSHSSAQPDAQHSSETSPRNPELSAIERSTSSASLPIHTDDALSVHQKAQSTSNLESVTTSSYLNNADDSQPVIALSSENLSTSSKAEEKEQSLSEATELSLTEMKFFRRQKYPVEADCARQVDIVAGILRWMDRDEALVNILVPFSGHKTATDFMTKVLTMADSECRSYDDLPESMHHRLCERDSRHAAL